MGYRSQMVPLWVYLQGDQSTTLKQNPQKHFGKSIKSIESGVSLTFRPSSSHFGRHLGAHDAHYVSQKVADIYVGLLTSQ